MNRMTRLLALAASTGLALAAGAADAGEAHVIIVNAGQATDAVKVVRDQETGRLRAATAEEIAQMAQAPARARAKSRGPSLTILNRPNTTMITHADGSATIRRSLDDLDSLVATRNADGKLDVRHGGKVANAVPSTASLPKE